jgi:hypothetical protein
MLITFFVGIFLQLFNGFKISIKFCVLWHPYQNLLKKCFWKFRMNYIFHFWFRTSILLITFHTIVLPLKSIGDNFYKRKYFCLVVFISYIFFGRSEGVIAPPSGTSPFQLLYSLQKISDDMESFFMSILSLLHEKYLQIHNYKNVLFKIVIWFKEFGLIPNPVGPQE